jgi:hypothetical protein
MIDSASLRQNFKIWMLENLSNQEFEKYITVGMNIEELMLRLESEGKIKCTTKYETVFVESFQQYVGVVIDKIIEPFPADEINSIADIEFFDDVNTRYQASLNN